MFIIYILATYIMSIFPLKVVFPHFNFFLLSWSLSVRILLFLSLFVVVVYLQMMQLYLLLFLFVCLLFCSKFSSFSQWKYSCLDHVSLWHTSIYMVSFSCNFLLPLPAQDAPGSFWRLQNSSQNPLLLQETLTTLLKTE